MLLPRNTPIRLTLPSLLKIRQPAQLYLTEPAVAARVSSLSSRSQPRAASRAAMLNRISELKVLSKAALRSKTTKGTARYSYQLGGLLELTGNTKEALQQYGLFLEACVEMGDEDGLLLALNSLGCCTMKRGEYEDSLVFHKRAAGIDDGRVGLISNLNAVICLIELGRVEEARQQLAESKADADSDQLRRISMCLQSELLQKGQQATFYTQLEKELREVSDKQFKVRGYGKLAELDLRRSNSSRAKVNICRKMELAYNSNQLQSVTQSKLDFAVACGERQYSIKVRPK